MLHGFCFLFGLLLVHLTSGYTANVALNKPASMSSYYRNGYLRAAGAVDGNTSSWGNRNVIKTAEDQSFAWWKVDLQREVQDATVTIFFRTDYKWRRNGLRLYTSTSPFSSYPEGQLCHTVTGKKDGSDIASVYNTICPGRWRYLQLYTDTGNDADGPVLDFGEVAVEACSAGTYGRNCTKTCSSRKCVTMTTTCERDGRCSDGCQTGWAGLDCSQECKPSFYGCGCSLSCYDRKCLNSSSPCDHLTGQCVGGCKARYIGIDCIHECPVDTFGSDCTSCSTRHCQGESDCPADGTCSQGCQNGWIMNTCTQVCMGGTYGPDCTEKCGRCDGVCDSVDGRCPAGCLDGYNGTKCDVALATQAVDGHNTILDAPVIIVAPVAVGCTLLLVGGVLLCLVRLGRLQWVKNPKDRNSVLVSRDNIPMDSTVGQPVSNHAHSSCQVPTQSYEGLAFETREEIPDYGVIEHGVIQNYNVTEESFYENF